MIPCVTEVLGESGFGRIYYAETSTFAHFFSLLSVHLIKTGLLFLAKTFFMQN